MLVMKWVRMSNENLDEFTLYMKDMKGNPFTVIESDGGGFDIFMTTNKGVGEFYSFIIKSAHYIIDTTSWGFLINNTGTPVLTSESKEKILMDIMMYSLSGV